MKTILILSALLLLSLAGAAVYLLRQPTHYGTFTGAPAASLTDLLDRPGDFRGKTVTVEGVVRKQCTTTGCYFFFQSRDRWIRVELSDITPRAPQKNGHPARVEGQLVPWDHEYQIVASAVQFD